MAFSTPIQLGYPTGPYYAETCEKLRKIVTRSKNSRSIYYNDLVSAINKYDWGDPKTLGKVVQQVYTDKKAPVQIVILDSKGKPLYYEKDFYTSSNNAFYKMFFVYKDYKFTLLGILNLNKYFQTPYFCTKCFSGYSKKNHDRCLK